MTSSVNKLNPIRPVKYVRALLANISAHDRSLDDAEKCPTGDDYNHVFAIMETGLNELVGVLESYDISREDLVFKSLASAEIARDLAKTLIAESAFFQVTPLPGDTFEVAVKADRADLLSESVELANEGASILDRLQSAAADLAGTDGEKAVRSAIDLIKGVQGELNGEEWNSDTVQAIADRLTDEGLIVTDPIS